LGCIVFHYRGVVGLALKIASDVGYHILSSAVEQAKELNFDEADVWLDFNNKALDLFTNNGYTAINFDTYDELLNAIIRLGRELAFHDIVGTLNHVTDDLMFYKEHPQLKIADEIIKRLISEVEKARNELYETTSKLIIKMGELDPKEIDNFINSNAEIKKVVEDATEKYRELCWKGETDDDPDECDEVLPAVDVIYYAIPEEKSIMVVVKVNKIGEVYKHVEKYSSAYDFLKAVDEYSSKVVDFW